MRFSTAPVTTVRKFAADGGKTKQFIRELRAVLAALGKLAARVPRADDSCAVRDLLPQLRAAKQRLQRIVKTRGLYNDTRGVRAARCLQREFRAARPAVATIIGATVTPQQPRPQSPDPDPAPATPLERYAQELIVDGVTVLPVGSLLDHAAFADYVDNIPERSTQGPPTAVSGFGAIDHPSAYHNTAARNLRDSAYKAVRPLMQRFVRLAGLDPDTIKLELLIDRLLDRGANQHPMPESAHRDESAGADPNDMIFGGWYAHSDGDALSCVLGTHIGPDGKLLKGAGASFSKIPKDDADQLHRTVVKVPKGHLVLLRQAVVHDVRNSRLKPGERLQRTFMGWRLTESDTPLHFDSAPITRKGCIRSLGGVVKVIPGFESPGWVDVFLKMLTPPLPSSQYMGSVAPFKWSMDRGGAYSIIRTYKPELYGLTAWPDTADELGDNSWRRVAWPDPQRVTECLQAVYPPYRESELIHHYPCSLGHALPIQLPPAIRIAMGLV